MKLKINYYYLIICFISQLYFSQKVYNFTNGELQFIHPSEGIIIKKNKSYYQLRIKYTSNHKDHKIEFDLIPIEENKIKELKQDKNTIYYNDIQENYDYNKLKELCFFYIDDYDDFKDDYYSIKRLYQFNHNYFTIFYDVHDKKNIYTRIEEVLPYIYIVFGNKKIIYTLEDDYIIFYSKNKLKVKGLNYNYFPDFFKTEKLQISNKDIYDFSQHMYSELKEDFLKIDTLPNKKVILKNIHNEILISNSYDSISVQPIIECYNQNKIDLYNLTFKKINSRSLRYVKSTRGNIQIMDRNIIKWIDWTGKKLKKRFTYHLNIIPEGKEETKHFYEFTMSKKNNKYILKKRNFNWLPWESEKTKIDSVSLINTKGIKDFYFQNNTSKDTIHKFQYDDINFGFGNFNEEIVYYVKENGTYGMKYLGNFLNDITFDVENTQFKNFTDYQNLEYIKFNHPFYLIKKNNLYGIFPLQDKYRYKKISIFKENFARFELPNGQKGFLDIEGKEYLDD